MNYLKPTKINKWSKQLLLSLSCLGALLISSCNNDDTKTEAEPILQKVGFSAATADGSHFSIEANDEVTLYIDDEGSAAKYYTDSDRKRRKTFPDNGQKFTFKTDDDGSIVIDGGFYLASAAGDGQAYTLKRLDIDKGGDGRIEYILNEDYPFKVITGKTNAITPTVVDKIEGEVKKKPRYAAIKDAIFRNYLKRNIAECF